MRILLLHPNSPVTNGSPPLSLGYLGGILEKKGHVVKIIDSAAPYARYNVSDLVSETKKFKPDMVGLTISTTFSKFAYQLADALFGLSPLMIAGGPHPTLMPQEALDHNIKIVIRGEGEEAILELIEFMEGKIELTYIAGISYRDKDDRIIHNHCRDPIINLDNLPLPAKHLFNNLDYAKSQGEFIRYGNIMTSRGCPYGCVFCSSRILGKEFRYRNSFNVLEEIKYLQAEYKVNTFFILDDVFTFNQERVIALCRLFKGLNTPIRWTCITRVDLITPELLAEMARAGCYSITYGIESGSQNTLNRIGKGVSPDTIKNCITMTKQASIKPHASFMFGFPWENSRDIQSTRLFLKEILANLTYIVNGGIVIPYPGTELYAKYSAEYGLEEWWLKVNLRWWGYRTIADRPFAPFFEKLFFKDLYILKTNFFKYRKEVKKEMKKFIYLLGTFNVFRYAYRLNQNRIFQFIYTSILLICVTISRFSHMINPVFERRLFTPAGFLIQKIINQVFIEK